MRKAEYLKLLSMEKIIKSLQMCVKINISNYMKECQQYLYKCIFIKSIIDYYNYNNSMDIIKKPRRKVFFATKELFSSNFKSFKIETDDYLIGKIPNVQCNMISTINKDEIIDILSNLNKQYQLSYFILNPYTNECEEVSYIKTNIPKIEISELNLEKLYKLFLDLEIRYVYTIANAHLNLYKSQRIDTAEDNINLKCRSLKKNLNKDILSKINKSIYLKEGGVF